MPDKKYSYKIVRPVNKKTGKKYGPYVYRGGERVTDKEEIKRALRGEKTDVKYVKGARELQKKATQIRKESEKALIDTQKKLEKDAYSSMKKDLRNKIRYNRRKVTDAHGNINYKLLKELKDQVKSWGLSAAKTQEYINYLTPSTGNINYHRPNLHLGSLLGMIKGNKLETMLYNTGYPIGQMAEDMNAAGDNVTAADLSNESNWDDHGVYFVSPSGFTWIFHFRYLKFPFDLQSAPHGDNPYNDAKNWVNTQWKVREDQQYKTGNFGGFNEFI